MAFNLEDKIRWEELAPSLQAFLKKLQKMIEDEIARAKSAEKKLSDRIDKIWGSDGEKSSHDITEIWKKIKKLEGDLGKVGGKIDGVADTIAKNLDITLGCYGVSPTATVRKPGHGFDDPNHLGEWLLGDSDFGEMHVYRHVQVITNGTDVTWASLNGFSNLKFCTAKDSVFVQFSNKQKEYFVSVPNAMCSVVHGDSDGNIMSNDGSSWSAKVDSWTGGTVSCVNCLLYTDIAPKTSANNIRNNPSLNGNAVKIFKVSQTNANEWLTLTIPGGYPTVLGNYTKDKVYSALEIAQNSQVNIYGSHLSAVESNLPMKFLDDATWLSLIRFDTTEAGLLSKLP